ncbi:unnamed protein product [Clonostachys byssicola]|uniref:Uncharacterized protein n=1 Tax=Clonostachys byssicola TaxID=160290 RepID=A0A9N9UD49_9HYPO|nr:unnamed protein product [Clonostachys byssicola]
MADNKGNSSGSGGLSKFPREILSMICENLCSHCTSKPQDGKDLDWGNLPSALLALSKTCRVLREIAQPITYHVVASVPNYAQFPKFIRTLDERPDLAAQIRWLCQHTYECGGWDYDNAEEVELVKGVAKRLGMQREDDVDFESADEEDTSLGKFCIELLIALAPNLEALQVYMENDGNYEGTKYYYTAERRRQIGLEAASLHRLKRLEIVTDDDWGVSANVPGIPVLLSLAPNLEHLSLYRCKGLSDEWDGEDEESRIIFRNGAISSLRVVEFKGSALEGDADTDSLISGIVSRAPQLERFSYQSQAAYLGEHIDVHFSARDFLRCLRRTKNSLKFLNIDLTEHSLHSDSGETIESHVLQSFTALETVKLDDTSFCRHRGNPEVPSTCLTDTLPTNLKTLVLRLYEGSQAWADLERLAAESRKFPNLRRVQIENILRMHSDVAENVFPRQADEHCNALLDAFAEKSIDFAWSITIE